MTHWIQAARLRTLPLSVSGIILGAFIARWRMPAGEWRWQVLALSLLVTLFYQVLSNFANDYGDSAKGTDQLRSHSVEQRAVASGKISLSQMRNAVKLFAGLSLVATLGLLYVAFLPDFLREFWIFVGLGVACILAAVGYTMGKKPYGYFGLGDAMVFFFFGWVSVGGSYFLFTKSWDWDILLPASAVGLLSAAVLNLNNMRDIDSDARSGKRTLALRLGFHKAMIYQMILMQLPLLLVLIFLLMNNLHTSGGYPFMVMILLFPMSAIRRKILQTKSPEALDPFLKQVGILTLTMAVLMAVGLNY